MTPCLIRGQFGAVIPSLAQDLLREALARLESICLARRCTDWPPVLATLATLCMAVESVQWHAAKEPYHAHFDASSCINSSSGACNGPAALNSSHNPRVAIFGPEKPPPPSSSSSFPASASSSSSFSSFHDNGAPGLDGDASLSATNEESVDRLLGFYRYCYRDCHCSRLQDSVPTASSLPERKQDVQTEDAVSTRFIDGLKASLRNARNYMAQRHEAGGSVLRAMSKVGRGLQRGEEKDAGGREQQPRDMSVFFDRLLVKLFLA